MRTGTRIWVLSGVVALAAATFSCWAFQDPLDTPAMKSTFASRGLLNGIAFSGKRLVAVGQRGHILYSDDMGKNWAQADVPVSSDLTAVFFPTPQKGWAVGHDGVVLASTDGGGSWVKQLDGREIGQMMADYYAEHAPFNALGQAKPLVEVQDAARRIAEEGPDKPFLAVWFESETTGYVVGVFNLIFRTTDGGKSWVPWFDRTDNPAQLHFHAINRVGGDLYLAGEQGMVLKLDTVAQRFRAVSVDYKGSLFGITGRENGVFVFGLRGNVFHSNQGEGPWKKVETGLEVAITGATLTEDGRIVLVSQAGDMLLSPDGGKTFSAAPGARTGAANAVASATPEAVVIAGARGVHVRPLKQ